MTDETNTNENKTPGEGENTGPEDFLSTLDDDGRAAVQELVKAQKAEELKQMKENMNRMSAERDEALKKAKEFEKAQRQREITAMEEAGKTSEAYEAKLADREAELETLRNENIRLTRDHTVDRLLSSVERSFRNSEARKMAFDRIVSQLVRDDAGRWVHNSGLSLDDYVKKFEADDNFEYLFEPRENVGTGADTRRNSDLSGLEGKKMSDLTPAEMIRKAAAGKLPGRGSL